MDLETKKLISQKNERIHNLEITAKNFEQTAATIGVLASHVVDEIKYVKTNHDGDRKIVEAHENAAVAICEKIIDITELFR